MEKLRAPFPWFGGKSRAAPAIWEGLGDVANYVEPFAGSLAVLLGRPTPARTETINDLDCYVANFWRALATDPEGLADHTDWPVNEADLHARHRWLVANENFREKMRTDPEFYDVKVAGWWVWGLSAWIGGGWCESNGKNTDNRRPMPCIGVTAPGNGSSMKGVHRSSLGKRPFLGGSGGGDNRGVNADRFATDQTRPALGTPGMGVHSARRLALIEEFSLLAERLRGVRVCCGDWTRVLTPSVTTGHGITGVILDPPYDQDERAAKLYATETKVSKPVREWAIEHGDNPLLRIVLCGYEGEHVMPPSWRVVEWKASGGYGRRDDNQNRHRERLWFSPACASATQGSLFS